VLHRPARRGCFRGAKISDVGLKELAALPQLKILDLGNTKIGDASLKELAGLQQLQTLDLTGTPVTKEGVAQLHKALPKLHVSQ
jgi:internalin A